MQCVLCSIYIRSAELFLLSLNDEQENNLFEISDSKLFEMSYIQNYLKSSNKLGQKMKR